MIKVLGNIYLQKAVRGQAYTLTDAQYVKCTNSFRIILQTTVKFTFSVSICCQPLCYEVGANTS